MQNGGVMQHYMVPEDKVYVFNNRFRNIENLLGAVGLDYYKFDMKDNDKIITKKIILISDLHEPIFEQPSSPNTITISEFIVYLIQSCGNLDKCVDFYLETYLLGAQGNPSMSGGMYISGMPKDQTTSIKNIRNIFKHCSHNLIDGECPVY